MHPEEQLSGLDDFLAALRFEGVPISPHQFIWLQHAFRLEPQLDRDGLKDLLACTLIKHESQRETFESLFEAWCRPADVQTGEPSESVEDKNPSPLDPSSPEPSPSDFELAAPKEPKNQPKTARATTGSWTSWRIWVSILALIGIGGLGYHYLPIEDKPITKNGSESSGDPGTGSSQSKTTKTTLPFDPAKEFWTWVPIPTPPSVAPTWAALVLAIVALLGGVFLWELYNSRKIVPAQEASPRAGPQWFPLFELGQTGPELLNREALRSAVWGVERFVSEDETTRIDIDETVTATAVAGGLPDMRFEHAVYPREVWLWQDDMVQDQTVNRLVHELTQRLTLAGLPVRVGTFVDAPTLVRWQDGQEFSPVVLEGHRQSALVVILSDGYGMQLAAESALEYNALATLLQSFTEWPRLTFVDVSDGKYNLAGQVQARGLQCIAPEDIPAFLGAAAVKPTTKRHAESDLFGDLRAWAAATALSSEPVTDESAFALRTRLDLGLSSWDFRDLLREAGSVGNRLSWSPSRKAELLNWLVQCSIDKGTVIADSPLDRALDYWLERYRTENTLRDAHQSALLQWRQTPAEQRLRLETALLELWRQPERAIPTLYQLSEALKDEVSERLRPFADWDSRGQTQRGRRDVVYLPWKTRNRSDQERWMLAKLGFASDPAQPKQPPGDLRPPVLMSLALGLSAGLALATLSFVMRPLLVPVAPVSPLVLSHPFQMIQATPESGEWKLVPNIQKFGRSELWRAGVLPQAIRGCEKDWPQRSFVIIQADPNTRPARQLAIQLLDKGSADAVLLGTDWAELMRADIPIDEDMKQLIQLIVIALPEASVPPIDFPGAFGVVRATEFEALAKRLDGFSGVQPLAKIWPKPEGDEQLMLRGGPAEETDKKTGITFVQVCGGTFRMGTEKDKTQYDNETPPHPVTLDSFEISKTETTNAQYQLFEKGYKGEENLPVANVSWDAAKAFCENFGYSLPTEAEWEYAARGGSTTLWSFGDDEKQLGDYAGFSENSGRQAHPVQKKLPNPLGLYDMHGNVYEWVEDCYDEKAYQNRSQPVIDPIVNPGIGSSCQSRVLGGGSFEAEAEALRSAFRFRDGSLDQDVSIGFRCVRRPRRQP